MRHAFLVLTLATAGCHRARGKSIVFSPPAWYFLTVDEPPIDVTAYDPEDPPPPDDSHVPIDIRHPNAEFKKAIWSSPKKRQEALATFRGDTADQVAEIKEGIPVGLTKKRRHVQGRTLLRLRELPPEERRLLYVLLDWENASKSLTSTAEAAKISVRRMHQIMSTTRFTSLLSEVRADLYESERVRLSHNIIQDAMVPFGAIDAKAASAFVKIRSQAAAFLGMTVHAPKVVLTASKSETTNRFEGYPKEALREWGLTGNWNEEKFGPPPWAPA